MAAFPRTSRLCHHRWQSRAFGMAAVLLLSLVLTATATQHLQFAKMRSSHKALYDDGNPKHRVLLFHDVIIWNGRLLYLTETIAAVPEIVTNWLKDDTVNSRISITPPSQLPFDAAAGLGAEEVQEALLGHHINYNNYYHQFAETLPTWHHLLCKYRQMCKYDPGSELRIFTIEDRGPGADDYAGMPAVQEVQSCLTKRHSVLHIGNSALHNKVVVLRNALAGLGPEVRAFHEWIAGYKETWKPPPLESTTLWRQRLVDCLGVDFVSSRVQRDKLRITFIDRRYNAGRHINNIELLRRNAMATYPAATVSVEYLEDMTFRQQVELYSSTSILVWPHGASMANLVFLPQGAAGVEIVPWPGVQHPHEWADDIVQNYGLNMTIVHITQEHRSHITFKLERMMADEEYMALSHEQKIALWERGECPPHVHVKCANVWNHYYVSFVLSWEQLGPALQQAWDYVHQHLTEGTSSKRSRRAIPGSALKHAAVVPSAGPG